MRRSDGYRGGARLAPYGLCHSEFHPTSLHVGASGWRLLDWARAFRGPGLIDLWELQLPDGKQEIEGWRAPFDAVSATSPEVRLAKRIQREIRSLVERGVMTGRECRSVQTTWMPQCEVERVEPAELKNVELGMEALAATLDAASLRTSLSPFIAEYGVQDARRLEVGGHLNPRERDEANPRVVDLTRQDQRELAADLIADAVGTGAL